MSIEPALGPGARGDGVSPHGDDDWGQDAVLDELMAAFGPGEEAEPPDDSFDPELAEFLADPESRTPPDGSADVAPECTDAGFLPRGGTGRPRLVHGGRGAGFASGAELDTALPGPALAGFADAAAGNDRSYTDLNDDELIGTLVGWQKTEAWAASGRLSAVAELIRRRPVHPGMSNGPGRKPAGWGKFCSDELAVALAISRQPAERMLGVAYDLAFRLPRTAQALREGRIDSYKAQIIAEMTRVLDDAGAAAAEALILADPAALAGKSPGQIRAMIGRAILQVDPDAARRRRERAQKDARIELWREVAGTAALCGFGLPPDEALAADQMISSRAQELRAAGMEGTMDQLRVRAYLDVLLGQDSSPVLADEDASAQQGTEAEPRTEAERRTETERSTEAPGSASDLAADSPDDSASRPDKATDQSGSDHGQAGPRTGRQTGGRASSNETGLAAQINLTIPLATLLGLAEQPGEAAGFGPLDPDLARAMATTAAAHPATIWCLTVTDAHGHPTAHGCARPTRRAGPRQPRSRAGPGQDDANGGLGEYRTWRLRPVANGPDLTIDLEPLAVTDCDHRHHTRAHDPSDKLRHLLHIRDGECTWPPCRRNARRCDFEHAIPWEAGGPTCACNAGPRCRHHHHQKQAHGWSLRQDLPGYHTWTTPAGRVYTSGPTSYPI